MPRSIQERMKDPVWWLEQVGHFFLGAAPSAAVSYSLAHWTPLPVALVCFLAAVVGIVPGWIRELHQNWGDKPARGSLEDSLLDLGFWVLGGMLGLLAALWA